MSTKADQCHNELGDPTDPTVTDYLAELFRRRR
jgi:hypothetical protein